MAKNSDITSTVLVGTPGPLMSKFDQGSVKVISNFDNNSSNYFVPHQEDNSMNSMITDFQVQGTPSNNVIKEVMSELEATVNNSMTDEKTYDF